MWNTKLLAVVVGASGIALLAGCAAQTPSGGSTTTTTSSTSQAYEVVGSASTMVQVVNNTGGPVLVKAMPQLDPAIPQPLGGIVVLATVGTGTSCVALPDTIRFSVNTAPFLWTASQGVSITAIDTTANRRNLVGTTAMFNPTTATGWAVTFAGAQSSVAPATPCEAETRQP